MLPGFSSDDLIAELHALLGDDLQFEIIRHDPGRPNVDMGLFALLKEIVEELDPDRDRHSRRWWADFTDGRMFARGSAFKTTDFCR